MDVVCTYEERNLTVHIQGEVDHHTSEEIRTKIEKEYERHHAKNIIFNLEGVTFMDSSGLGMIIGRYKSIETHGGQVAMAGVSPAISKIMQMSGLYKIMESYPNVKAAVSGLQSGNLGKRNVLGLE